MSRGRPSGGAPSVKVCNQSLHLAPGFHPAVLFIDQYIHVDIEPIIVKSIHIYSAQSLHLCTCYLGVIVTFVEL